MSLPVINTPTYELEIPSTKEKITYRPFLVKEEKILLVAMEEEDESQMIRAVRQIVQNCTFENVDSSTLPMFDLEYIFLRIRAKSVGEVATVNLLCSDDKETYVKVDIPLDEVTVKFDKEHKSLIDLTDSIKIQMLYPTFEQIQMLGDANTDDVFKLINACVQRIYHGEEIHERADFTDRDLDTFLDSLNTEQFTDIQKFFTTMPKLTYDVKFTNPKTKKKLTTTLEGMQSFF